MWRSVDKRYTWQRLSILSIRFWWGRRWPRGWWRCTLSILSIRFWVTVACWACCGYIDLFQFYRLDSGRTRWCRLTQGVHLTFNSIDQIHGEVYKDADSRRHRGFQFYRLDSMKMATSYTSAQSTFNSIDQIHLIPLETYQASINKLSILSIRFSEIYYTVKLSNLTFLSILSIRFGGDRPGLRSLGYQPLFQFYRLDSSKTYSIYKLCIQESPFQFYRLDSCWDREYHDLVSSVVTFNSIDQILCLGFAISIVQIQAPYRTYTGVYKL